MSVILKLIITYAIVRVIAAIGFAVITYGGVTYALNRAIHEIQTSYNSLPSEILQFLAIAGVPQFLGIILGAITFVSAIRFMKSIVYVGT